MCTCNSKWPFGSAAHVNRIVEIPRRLAVNRHDRQIAKIAPPCAGPLRDTCCGVELALQRSLPRENVRQMMLANDDLDVDADVAGTAENFNHAARRCETALRIARDLHVHHGAIQLRQPHSAMLGTVLPPAARA